MSILRFGVFEIDTSSGEFRKRGVKLRLREQPLRLLLTLVGNAGLVVSREQLRDRRIFKILPVRLFDDRTLKPT